MKAMILSLLILPIHSNAGCATWTHSTCAGAPKERSKVEILRDSKGHKTGSVQTDENGNQKIYDDKNHYKGQYRSDDNVTRDEKGHRVGSGNQTTRNLDK